MLHGDPGDAVLCTAQLAWRELEPDLGLLGIELPKSRIDRQNPEEAS